MTRSEAVPVRPRYRSFLVCLVLSCLVRLCLCVCVLLVRCVLARRRPRGFHLGNKGYFCLYVSPAALSPFWSPIPPSVNYFGESCVVLLSLRRSGVHPVVTGIGILRRSGVHPVVTGIGTLRRSGVHPVVTGIGGLVPIFILARV
jgi:hypothetical protein